MSKQKLKRLKGFTLIELLVVISIISLLSSLVLVSLSAAKAKANGVVKLSLVKEYQKALELYRIDHNSYPNGGNSEVNSDPNFTSWYCLGVGNTNGQCGEYNSYTYEQGFVTPINEDDTLNQSLAPYIHGPPSSNRALISDGAYTEGRTGNYNGILYQCTSYSDPADYSSPCMSYKMFFAVEALCPPHIDNGLPYEGWANALINPKGNIHVCIVP